MASTFIHGAKTATPMDSTNHANSKRVVCRTFFIAFIAANCRLAIWGIWLIVRDIAKFLNWLKNLGWAVISLHQPTSFLIARDHVKPYEGEYY